jgi:diaminopimelate epimerase
VNEIHFAKYSGSGNDFIMIDNRAGAFPATPGLIARMCERGVSIGADGLILVEPSQKAAVRMRYYNSDGGEVEMCGNGARCFVAFARELGIASEPLVFETMERVLSGWADGRAVTVELGEARATRLNLDLRVDGVTYRAHFTNTGVPHVVIFCYQLEQVDVETIGRSIRFHDQFQPNGTNVDFVHVTANGELEIRTYERGVEGETLACGTGVAAAAVIAHLVSDVKPPVNVHVRSGDVLIVNFRREGEAFAAITLSGPVTYVYDGIYRVPDAS